MSTPFAPIHGAPVATLLASPFDDVLVDGLPVRRLAEHALTGLRVVEPDQVPDDVALVIHDPACPTVPSSFVQDLVERVHATGRPHVAILTVTDTIKLTEGQSVGETLDREALATVASPVVVPPGVRPLGRDMTGILDDLRLTHEIVLVEAPSGVVRLSDARDVAFLADPASDGSRARPAPTERGRAASRPGEGHRRR